MRNAILAAMVAATLAGCGARSDDSICTAIIDPPTPPDVASSQSFQRDAEWQRKRADACVHRQAYRLAHSPDPATVVAKAVVEACESVIGASAAVNANHEMVERFILPGELTPRIEEIKASYEEFALLKIVEGRAGDCRG